MTQLDLNTLNYVIQRLRRIQSAYKAESMADLVIDGIVLELEELKTGDWVKYASPELLLAAEETAQ